MKSAKRDEGQSSSELLRQQSVQNQTEAILAMTEPSSELDLEPDNGPTETAAIPIDESNSAFSNVTSQRKRPAHVDDCRVEDGTENDEVSSPRSDAVTEEKPALLKSTNPSCQQSTESTSLNNVSAMSKMSDHSIPLYGQKSKGDLISANPSGGFHSTNPQDEPATLPGAVSVQGLGSTQDTTLPGVVAVDGVGAAVSGFSSYDGPANPVSLDREITAVAVSNKDIEEEVRRRILREAVQATVEQDPEQPRSSSRIHSISPCQLASCFIFLLVVVGAATGVILANRNQNDSEASASMTPSTIAPTTPQTPAPTGQPSLRPTLAPTASPTSLPERLLTEFLSEYSFDNGAALRTSGTPQRNAFIFLVDYFPELVFDERLVDLYVLLTLYNAAGGFRWARSENWYSFHEPVCNWEGITCGTPSDVQGRRTKSIGTRQLQDSSGGRVTEISLPDNQMLGFLPPELGMLKSLVSLDLSSNMLVGTCPPELGHLANLRSLDLSGNNFVGDIHEQVCAISPSISITVDCSSVACSCCTPECPVPTAFPTRSPVQPPTAFPTRAPVQAPTLPKPMPPPQVRPTNSPIRQPSSPKPSPQSPPNGPNGNGNNRPNNDGGGGNGNDNGGGSNNNDSGGGGGSNNDNSGSGTNNDRGGNNNGGNDDGGGSGNGGGNNNGGGGGSGNDNNDGGGGGGPGNDNDGGGGGGNNNDNDGGGGGGNNNDNDGGGGGGNNNDNNGSGNNNNGGNDGGGSGNGGGNNNDGGGGGPGNDNNDGDSGGGPGNDNNDGDDGGGNTNDNNGSNNNSDGGGNSNNDSGGENDNNDDGGGNGDRNNNGGGGGGPPGPGPGPGPAPGPAPAPAPRQDEGRTGGGGDGGREGNGRPGNGPSEGPRGGSGPRNTM